MADDWITDFLKHTLVLAEINQQWREEEGRCRIHRDHQAVSESIKSSEEKTDDGKNDAELAAMAVE